MRAKAMRSLGTIYWIVQEFAVKGTGPVLGFREKCLVEQTAAAISQ